jgi:hypothetical protein
VETLVHLIVLPAFLSLFRGSRALTVGLFLIALAATMLVFASHLTDPLKLSF